MNSNIQCPICANANLKNWAEKSGFQIYRCNKCTHIFADTHGVHIDYDNAEEFRSHITNNLMDCDEMYYRHLAESEKPGSHTWITARLILDHVSRHSVTHSRTWLDVGSGSGYLLAEAKKLGFAAVGIEPGGWGQFAARHKRITVVQGFLAPNTFDQRFDVISATDVIEHQSDPTRFLGLLVNYLNPEGMICLSFPYGSCWRARFLKGRWQMVMPPTHCQFFTSKSLTHVVTTFGLCLIMKKTFNSGGLPGMTRFGLSLTTTNRLLNAVGWGDQMLVVLKPLKAGEGEAIAS
jgi:2-polyprenyl-3-methyl-5-hydroxy-6-metoxy-1,4-benzoquinol methylase